jgi:hypothetical protein
MKLSELQDRAALRSSRVRICPKIRAAPQRLRFSRMRALSEAKWGEREKRERLVKSKSIEPITPAKFWLGLKAAFGI